MADDRFTSEIYGGFIRLHILYHAGKEPIYGLGIIEELGRHGYRLSPGTLYPILHRMAERGYLTSRERQVDGRVRRTYRITARGRRALAEAEAKLKELVGELFEE